MTLDSASGEPWRSSLRSVCLAEHHSRMEDHMDAFSFTHSAARGLPSTWGQRARVLIARGIANLAREIRIRRDLRLVSELDDAMLRDIGIARGGLEGAVRFGRATEQLFDVRTLRDMGITPGEIDSVVRNGVATRSGPRA